MQGQKTTSDNGKAPTQEGESDGAYNEGGDGGEVRQKVQIGGPLEDLKPSNRRAPPKYNPITTPLSGRISFSYTPASCAQARAQASAKCSPVDQEFMVGGGSFQWDEHSKCWVAHGSYQYPGAVSADKSTEPRVRKKGPRHPYSPVTVQRVQVTLCEDGGKELALGFMFTHPSATRVRPSGIPGRSSSDNLILLSKGLVAKVDKSASPKLAVRFEGRLERVSCYMAGVNAKNECSRQESGRIKGRLEGEIPTVAAASKRYYPFMTDADFAGLFAERLEVSSAGVAASTLKARLDSKERFSPLGYIQIDPQHKLLLFHDKENSALINAHVFDGKGFYGRVDIYTKHKGPGSHGRSFWDSSIETIFVDVDGDNDIDMVSREWSEQTTKARGKTYVEETERIRVSIWSGKKYHSQSTYRLVKNGEEKIFSNKKEIRRALGGKTFIDYQKSAAGGGDSSGFSTALSEIRFRPMYCPRKLSKKEKGSPAKIAELCRSTSFKVKLSQAGCRVCLNKSFFVPKHGVLTKRLPAGRYTATLEGNAANRTKLQDSVVTLDVTGRPQTILLLREPR